MSRSPLEQQAGMTPVDAAWSHRDDLVLYARRLLGAQGEIAEDVVQEAYLRLHERASAGDTVREPRPWLFRVTRNLALDERRRRRCGNDACASLEVVAARPKGPLEVLEGREEAREALEGLGSLPPREQRTVILEQAGLPPTAIARRMDTTPNAVHQSLFRARRRMREARAAAWGLVPLPIMRLVAKVGGSPALDSLPAMSSGSGGRFAGGAGIAGLVAAAIVGGGIVTDQVVVPHPAHPRASTPAPVPSTIPPAVSARGGQGPSVAAVVPAAAAPPLVRHPPATTAAPARLRRAAPAAAHPVVRATPEDEDDDGASRRRGRARTWVAPQDEPTERDAGSRGRGGDDGPRSWRADEPDDEASTAGREGRHGTRRGRSGSRETEPEPVVIPPPDPPESSEETLAAANPEPPATTSESPDDLPAPPDSPETAPPPPG